MQSIQVKLEAPYVGFHHFEKKHALLFFGRGAEVKALFEGHILQLKARQVLLFYGASGVGKSSLLHAGLFPRMEDQGWHVGYRRRNKEAGLDADLEALKQEALESSADPKLLLLDQVEEMFTDPGKEEEVSAFFSALDETLTHYPHLKIVLSFRKEYLADVKDQLKDRGINFLWYSLRALQEEGVRQAIHGVFRNPELLQQFEGLKSLEPALEKALVKDVMSEEPSKIALLLQGQLRTIWDKAVEHISKKGSIILRKSLYQGETSLKDFLEKQKLKNLEKQFPEAAHSGLINDILFYYTAPNLTAASRSQFNYLYRYRHLLQRDRRLLSNIQQALIDEHLLICNGQEGRSRFAHDVLARIVRRRFRESFAPGQRAFAVINAGENPGAVNFSEVDISIIEAGREGMPAVSRAMEEKIKADREEYDLQKKQRLDLALSSARSDIEHLRFEEALTNLQIAAREGLARDQILELAWQLPFPLNELGQASAVKDCLEFIGAIQQEKEEQLQSLPESFFPAGGFREGFKNWLNSRDATIFEEMQKRHFPAMRQIEGGAYDMGSEEGYTDEKPVHQVTVSTFQMSETPVTFWQYGLFCLQTGRDIPRDSGFGRGNHPVINVSWYDAVEYCNWLSEWFDLEKVYEVEGENVTADWNKNGFRLPTEAEWEYAAREGGKNVRFGNGKNAADPKQMNFDAGHPNNEQRPDWHVPGRGWSATTPVREFEPNELGMYDMSGNVLEWCWDIWSQINYYERSEGAQDPTGPAETIIEQKRVVRGGSWSFDLIDCRCSFRFRYYPFFQINLIGFRVVRRPKLSPN